MNDITSEQVKPVRRLDPSQIKDGQYISSGMIYNADGSLVGSARAKEYASQEEYEKDLKDLKDETAESQQPRPILWGELDAMKFSEQRWRIKNIIPLEGFVILASPSGEKKTWLALEMARCVTEGIQFLGDEGFETLPGNVLYVDQEMSRSELQRRGRLLKLFPIKNKLWFVSQSELNLDDDGTRAWLIDFINTNRIIVVFVDTFRAVAGGLREEKAEEIRRFFNSLKPLKDQEVAIVFLDHCRKPSQYEGRVPKKEQLFASQDKLASVEVLLMIRSEERSEEIRVHQLKNRLGIEQKPFRVLMENVLDAGEKERINLKFAGEADDREFKKDEAKESIVAILQEGGKKRKEILDIVRKEKHIGSKNTSEALRELETDGKISVKKQGRENYYELPIEVEDGESQANVLDQSNLLSSS